jgi:hypothetical protein
MDKFGRTRRIILIGTVMIAGGLASSVRADDSNTGSLNLAGIIIYKINQDGTLDGRWTHPDLKGMTGTERATGGTPGKLDGTYKVETYDEGNKEIFRGSLDIKPIGVLFVDLDRRPSSADRRAVQSHRRRPYRERQRARRQFPGWRTAKQIKRGPQSIERPIDWAGAEQSLVGVHRIG